MEQRNNPMEIRINESHARRRQKTHGQTEKTGKTRHAIAVKNDVAINENIISVVHPTNANVVRSSAPSHSTSRSSGIPSVASMAGLKPPRTERIPMVPLLLILGWHYL
jgi:hypothetical protein